MRAVRLVTAAIGLTATLFAWQEQPNQPPKGEQQHLLIPTQTQIPPPPPDPRDFRVKSEVELVLLDVSVKDRDGGFVSGLTKENFQVFDNKVEQPIRVFAAQDAPVTVGLVVDNSGSVRPKKPDIVTAALTFVTQSNPQDEVFIVNFNDRVVLGLPPEMPFSDNRQLLRQALLLNPAQGRTALYDALKLALEHLDKGRLDKKTLVLVSDGGDNASDTTKDEIMKLAERSLATIYTVGIFNPDDRDKNPGFLKALAKLTGGEAYIPENSSHLVGICEKIAHDIRNRYTVGFSPTAGPNETKAHPVRVNATDANNRKLDVRTRTHYFPRGAALQSANKSDEAESTKNTRSRTTPEKSPEPETPKPAVETPQAATPEATPPEQPVTEPQAPPTQLPAEPQTEPKP
jgi:VWFA-related protein